MKYVTVRTGFAVRTAITYSRARNELVFWEDHGVMKGEAGYIDLCELAKALDIVPEDLTRLTNEERDQASPPDEE